MTYHAHHTRSPRPWGLSSPTHILHKFRRVKSLSPWSSISIHPGRPFRRAPIALPAYPRDEDRGINDVGIYGRIVLHATPFPLRRPLALLETARRKNPSIQESSPALAGLSSIFLNPHPQPHRLTAPPNFPRTTFEWPKKKISFNRIFQSHTFGVRSEYLPAYPHIFSLPSPEAKTPFSVPSFATRASAAALNDPPNPSRFRTRANSVLRPVPFLFYRQGIFVRRLSRPHRLAVCRQARVCRPAALTTIPPVIAEEVADIKDWMAVDRTYEGVYRNIRCGLPYLIDDTLPSPHLGVAVLCLWACHPPRRRVQGGLRSHLVSSSAPRRVKRSAASPLLPVPPLVSPSPIRRPPTPESLACFVFRPNVTERRFTHSLASVAVVARRIRNGWCLRLPCLVCSVRPSHR
ncbi:hypothetical protein DFH08DRAFT_950574 [Mycena albidolilacea]|uniref:Uncharacterized protein n=1 Tax=Mycena albidolilacea TaxID=1033008 RepID=A0AAD7ALX6_9AGAR|nr:hypothetical protein DFH08DRAFT_950574 [Mycena albidolilacea]